MHDPFLAPELVITTYKGSPVSLVFVPTQGGASIDDLDSYDQIDFSVFAGSRDAPGVKVLDVRFTGLAPLYIAVITVNDPNVPPNSKAIQVSIPGSVMLALAPGQYFAELWLTPPGGEEAFTNYAIWLHMPTTAS